MGGSGEQEEEGSIIAGGRQQGVSVCVRRRLWEEERRRADAVGIAPALARRVPGGPVDPVQPERSGARAPLPRVALGIPILSRSSAARAAAGAERAAPKLLGRRPHSPGRPAAGAPAGGPQAARPRAPGVRAGLVRERFRTDPPARAAAGGAERRAGAQGAAVGAADVPVAALEEPPQRARGPVLGGVRHGPPVRPVPERCARRARGGAWAGSHGAALEREVGKTRRNLGGRA